MRVDVVGTDGPAGTSRDPATMAARLTERGHDARRLLVTPALPVPALHDARGAEAPAERTDVVLTFGLDACFGAAVLARRCTAPLVVALPPADLPPLAVAPAAAGLALRHLPLAAVLVESARHRVLAVGLGADPARTVVIPAGVPLAEARRRQDTRAAKLAVLIELTEARAADVEFCDRLRTRLAAREDVDVYLQRVEGEPYSAESPAPGRSPKDAAIPSCWDLVLVPGSASDPTVPLLRSMAAGSPVLTTDSPLGAEVLASMRHGLMAAEDDLDEWTEKASYVLSDTALQTHLGRGARAHVEMHADVLHTVTAVENRLRSVLNAWNHDPLPVHPAPDGWTA